MRENVRTKPPNDDDARNFTLNGAPEDVMGGSLSAEEVFARAIKSAEKKIAAIFAKEKSSPK